MNGEWLRADFHIHTPFSDGELDLEEVINLYGMEAFEVIICGIITKNIGTSLMHGKWQQI
jgi:hypothetical protein